MRSRQLAVQPLTAEEFTRTIAREFRWDPGDVWENAARYVEIAGLRTDVADLSQLGADLIADLPSVMNGATPREIETAQQIVRIELADREGQEESDIPDEDED